MVYHIFTAWLSMDPHWPVSGPHLGPQFFVQDSGLFLGKGTEDAGKHLASFQVLEKKSDGCVMLLHEVHMVHGCPWSFQRSL